MRPLLILSIIILLFSCGSKRAYSVYQNTTNNEKYTLVLYKDSTFLLEWSSNKIDMLGGYGYGLWSQKESVFTLNSYETNRIDSIEYSNQNICNQLKSYEQFTPINYQQSKSVLFETDCNDLMQIRLYDSKGNSLFVFGQIAINEDGKTYRTDVFQIKNTDSTDVVTYLEKQSVNSLEVYYDGWAKPVNIAINNLANSNTIIIHGNFVSTGLRPKILINEEWILKSKNIIENDSFGKLKRITTAKTMYN